MREIQSVACIGGGTVGGGWAANFLAAGLDVRVWDPSPDGANNLHQRVDAAWTNLEKIGLAPGASRDRLRFDSSMEAALDGADFVQESAPDNKVLKVKLLREIDALLPSDVTIASSSSTFIPSELSAECTASGRVLIGHPFVPVYLVPLVEVLGHAATLPARVDHARAFYEGIGKRVVVLTGEIEGYIATRLQRAQFEEASRLVAAGVCDWDAIEDAVTLGPGFRAPVLGPVLHRHLGGGAGGVRHMIDHFGWPGEAGGAEAFIETVDNRWGTRSVAELEAERDSRMVRILDATR